MSNPISFDAAMHRIFGDYVDKNDILEEVEYLAKKLDPIEDKDHIAFLETLKMAMQEKI